jgi:hypothetical protein
MNKEHRAEAGAVAVVDLAEIDEEHIDAGAAEDKHLSLEISAVGRIEAILMEAEDCMVVGAVYCISHDVEGNQDRERMRDTA